MKEIQVDTPFGRANLTEKGKYPDGSTALYIHNNKGPICTLTVNLDTGPLNKDHYVIKTWSENAPTCAMLLEQGIFEDTGARIPAGYTEAEIWKLKE